MSAKKRAALVAPARKAKATPALRISEEQVEQIRGRLRRVEGQVQAVQRMLAERRDCHAIAVQMSAARAALDRATIQLMTTSMAECLTSNGSSPDHEELARLTDTFVKLLS
jgi:DNA-binding FrmR family transcriptional regulator